MKLESGAAIVQCWSSHLMWLMSCQGREALAFEEVALTQKFGIQVIGSSILEQLSEKGADVLQHIAMTGGDALQHLAE